MSRWRGPLGSSRAALERKMNFLALFVMPFLIVGCMLDASRSGENVDCGQWVRTSVSSSSLVKRVAISEVDSFFRNHSSVCMQQQWESMKLGLSPGDEIWQFHQVLGEGGYVVITSGVPGKAIVTWAH